MPEKPERAAIYLRVSTAAQAEQHSLPAQRRLLRELAARNSWEVVREYEDPGISGETISARPAFRELLADAVARRFDVLAVIDLDRLTRSSDLREWATITETLKSGGVRIVTPSQELDPTDADDSFVAALLALLSGREKTKILARSRRGMEQAIRDGKRAGCSRGAYGYRYSRDTRSLEVVPEEAAVVREIVRLYLDEGWSMDEIARDLNRRGVPTRGGKKWWPSQIGNSLRRPVYTGHAVWGRFSQTRDEHGRRHRARKAKDEWVWSEQPAHEAIIEQAEWKRIQAEMARRSRHKVKPNYWDSEFVLTGVVFCWCGARMHGHKTTRPRPEGEDKVYRSYRCSAVKTGAGYHKNIRAGEAEETVVAAVAAIGESPEFIEHARRRIVLDRMREGTSTGRSLEALREELDELKRRQGVLYDDRLAGRLDVERWQRFHEDLVAREEEIAGRIRADEAVLLAAGGGAHSVGEILDVLRDFRRVFDRLDARERKLLLQALVERVVADNGGRVRVDLATPWRDLVTKDAPRPRTRRA